MEPVRLPFTRAMWPCRSAEMPMISSAALPKLALSRLPVAGPIRSASSSVALPMVRASGTSERQLMAKVSASLCAKWWTAHAAGTSSQAARHNQRGIMAAS